MIVALEFYVRSLDLRNNLPIPCSFCLESSLGDRKVVTLNEAYRQPELVAVRHWHLSDCIREQTLPVLTEKIVRKSEVFDHDFVVVPKHRILSYYTPYVPCSFNLSNRPLYENQFNTLYDNFLRTDIHLRFKEVWIWREFLKAYLPFMASIMWDERDEVNRLREMMSLVQTNQQELWHKWLRWRKYMLDLPGLPGEIAFCREYGKNVFDF